MTREEQNAANRKSYYKHRDARLAKQRVRYEGIKDAQAAARKEKQVNREPVACLDCGGPFVPKKVTARFCGDACARRAWKKANREVVRRSNRESYHRNPASKLESGKRYYESNKERKAETVALWQSANREKVRAAAVRYRLANPDKAAQAKAKWAAANPSAVRAGYQRRRARKRAATVERFRDKDIFDRDLWRCQLCGGRVNSRRRHPDPLSASLDHIVPLDEGGAHARANVQLAHLRCNLSKGTRRLPDGEQLRLVG